MKGCVDVAACHMCSKALTDDWEPSWVDLGSFCASRRMLIRSNAHGPTELLVEELLEDGWHTTGYYRPRYCPNCGRELVENQKL